MIMVRTDTFLQSSSARIGLIILLVLVASAAYLASNRPLDALRASEREPASAKVAAPTQVARIEPAPPAAVPVTPVYAARSEPSPSTPIYRCKSGSRTIYTQEPCENGRIVVTSSAVDGYDSKPSERMERLVADGRPQGTPTTPTYVVRPRPSSGDCALLAQQVLDLDAWALQPHSRPTLDEIRQRRQDVRTSMARLHC
jgi:hypothetical protein